MTSSKGKAELLEDASETGEWKLWPGGRGSFSAAGTFDGATVALQTKGPDGITPINLGSATDFTEAGIGNFLLPPSEIRAAVTGGSNPSGLYANAVHVGA